MTLPGFTAEASLYRTERSYRATVGRLASADHAAILTQTFCDGNCCCNNQGHCVCDDDGPGSHPM